MILETNLKKSTLALSALTLALAAGLSACGGGTSTYTVGGTVSGLQNEGLILSNNGEDLPVSPRGYDEDPTTKVKTLKPVPYTFTKQLDYGERYTVKVKQQPAHQVCEHEELLNPTTTSVASDIAGRLSVINASFVCALATHKIGGTVSGLTSEGLILTNGSNGKLAIAKDATSFEFTDNPVVYGQTYGVTVLEQPKTQTCSVTNGAGEMGDVDVKTILVTCQ
jgi:hypothetical protein